MPTRWTEAYLQELVDKGLIRGFVTKNQVKNKKRSKYNNTKVEVDGFVFDSKKEAKRWGQLKILLKAGKIGLLERQVEYRLEVEGKKIAKYLADFRYLDTETGETIVEDVKSDATRKLSTYRLKKKLMWAIHKIEIKEV